MESRRAEARAELNEASTFSTPPNIGLPTPAGMPTAAHSMTPPTLSAASRARSISSRIFFSAPASRTAKKRVFSAFSSAAETETGSNSVSETFPMRQACAPIVTPRRSRICRQTAPANTRQAVSRPEKCPPPRISFAPL